MMKLLLLLVLLVRCCAELMLLGISDFGALPPHLGVSQSQIDEITKHLKTQLDKIAAEVAAIKLSIERDKRDRGSVGSGGSGGGGVSLSQFESLQREVNVLKTQRLHDHQPLSSSSNAATMNEFNKEKDSLLVSIAWASSNNSAVAQRTALLERHWSEMWNTTLSTRRDIATLSESIAVQQVHLSKLLATVDGTMAASIEDGMKERQRIRNALSNQSMEVAVLQAKLEYLAEHAKGTDLRTNEVHKALEKLSVLELSATVTQTQIDKYIDRTDAQLIKAQETIITLTNRIFESEARLNTQEQRIQQLEKEISRVKSDYATQDSLDALKKMVRELQITSAINKAK